MTPDPSLFAFAFMLCADPVSRIFTWSGVSVERCWSRSATTPVVTAAACEVPEPRKKLVHVAGSKNRAAGKLLSSIDPGTRKPATPTPGAITSGFLLPSPTLDQSGTVDRLVALSYDAAPTAITKGSDAGLPKRPSAFPSFPAETITTTPAAHAFSTAWVSGSTM